MNIQSKKLTAKEYGQGVRNVKIKGEMHTVDTDDFVLVDKSRVIHYVLISDILPNRYENSNKGRYKSNNFFQVKPDIKGFHITESVANGQNFTTFELNTTSSGSNADTIEGYGRYESDEFVVADDGSIKLVEPVEAD